MYIAITLHMIISITTNPNTRISLAQLATLHFCNLACFHTQRIFQMRNDRKTLEGSSRELRLVTKFGTTQANGHKFRRWISRLATTAQAYEPTHPRHPGRLYIINCRSCSRTHWRTRVITILVCTDVKSNSTTIKQDRPLRCTLSMQIDTHLAQPMLISTYVN